MRVLITNDDGIDAPGIRALMALGAEFGDVFVVAPDTEQSAKSHALTMNTPLRAPQVREHEWAVSGTPVDCVYLAVESLLSNTPDLVLSGINRGANLGHDVFYSGTVAAALEGALRNIPSIAVSLDGGSSDTVWHWQTAISVVRKILSLAVDGSGPMFSLLNVNVPNIPLKDLRGVVVTPLGHRQYQPLVIRREDPRFRPYYWIGGTRSLGGDAGTDNAAVHDGWATITPLRPDFTDSGLVNAPPAWLSGLTGRVNL